MDNRVLSDLLDNIRASTGPINKFATEQSIRKISTVKLDASKEFPAKLVETKPMHFTYRADNERIINDATTLPSELVAKIENEFNLGKAYSVSYVFKDESAGEFVACFGKNKYDCLEISSHPPAESFFIEKNILLADRPVFEYSVIWMNPDRIELCAPGIVRLVGDMAQSPHIYDIKRRSVGSQSDKALRYFKNTVGPFLKSAFANSLDSLKGFSEDDYFNAHIHHGPSSIYGSIMHRHWASDGPLNKITTDIHKGEEIAKIPLARFLGRVEQIENKIRSAYAELPAYVKSLPVPEISGKIPSNAVK